VLNKISNNIGDRAVHWVDKSMRWLYVATDGRIGHHQRGITFLLLTTTGRKSGKTRVHTLRYVQDGQSLIVVASNNGGDTNPAWYLNLSAQPQVHLQVGREKGIYCARTTTGDERSALWPKLIGINPAWKHHQEKTQRLIPIVILTRGEC
jgi:deazaflavin-dependent oxidoreductase (nitroreductase family)